MRDSNSAVSTGANISVSTAAHIQKGGDGNLASIAKEFTLQHMRLQQEFSRFGLPEDDLAAIHAKLGTLNGTASGSGKLPRFVIIGRLKEKKERVPICHACVGISFRQFDHFEAAEGFIAAQEESGHRLLEKEEMRAYIARFDDPKARNLIFLTGTEEGEEEYPRRVFYEYNCIFDPCKEAGDADVPKLGHVCRFNSEHISAFRTTRGGESIFAKCKFVIVTCLRESVTAG